MFSIKEKVLFIFLFLVACNRIISKKSLFQILKLIYQNNIKGKLNTEMLQRVIIA